MENDKLDGRNRNNIHIGELVEIVQKHHQRSGELIEGVAKVFLQNWQITRME